LVGFVLSEKILKSHSLRELQNSSLNKVCKTGWEYWQEALGVVLLILTFPPLHFPGHKCRIICYLFSP